VDGLVTTARRLGAEVVAEGVEDLADLDHLRRSGIRLAQGHLLCRPSPPEQLRGRRCA
jgi:EAL domain-containing protein (putative c-di-GMP-specific phosphodiesterase class I)